MTEFNKPSTIMDLIRLIFSFIDKCAFYLLTSMYMVFFNVAEAELFSNETVKNFYTRIQLIIGIFMVFKLSISVLEAIISPEKLTAKKTGTMSIIARIFISLALLTALMPINIPNPSNEYERKLKNNGLIFGILYSFQHRVLSNNTLGILILGSDAYTSNSEDGNDDFKIMGDSLKDAANTFASTLLRTFMRINLVPEDERVTDENGKANEFNPQNWVCTNINDDVIDEYKKIDADPQKLLKFINLECDSGQGSFWAKLKKFGNKLAFNSYYVFTYLPLSGIAAAVFAFLLLTFTVDIAIRSIKLAILRLIAPIPVISYMSPNGKDSGALGTWAKALTSTYLDIFIRLTMVYIVIYLIQDIIHNGIALGTTGGLVGGISFVLICLGLFLFARQAPKFIKDALGMKGPGMSNIGLNAVLAGVGAKKAGGTMHDALDAARDSVDTGINAYNQGKAAPGLFANYNSGRDYAAKMITGDDKMTWNQMHRGMNNLAREGITPENSDAVHSAALEASSFTKTMEDNAKKGIYTYKVWNSARGAYDDVKYKYTDGAGHIQDVGDNGEGMDIALEQQRTRSAKLESSDNKIDAEVKKYGGNRSWRDKNRREPHSNTYQAYRSDRFNSRYRGGPDSGTTQAGIDTTTHL